ncbi:hypothetical protein PGQ11_009839 [Apiospora arundinis]|uniref:Uncharacterized protein n=1 Tax=Apiospora arundinis TaxID=335852 RepID=A0ABR2I7Z2_9PEZI
MAGQAKALSFEFHTTASRPIGLDLRNQEPSVNLDSRLDKTICFECPPNLLLFLLRCIPRPTPDDQLCSILTAHLKNKHHLDASFSDFFKASPRCRVSTFYLGLGRRDRRI